MQKHKYMIMVLLLTTMILITSLQGAAADITWMSYERGIERAENRDKLILLYAGTDTCSFCVLMEQEVFTDKDVIQAMRDFVTVKVDSASDVEIAQQLEIQYVPTIVFLTPEGDELLREVGYRSTEELLSDMDEAEARYLGDETDEGEQDDEDTPFPGLFYSSVGLLAAVVLYTVNQKKKRSRR